MISPRIGIVIGLVGIILCGLENALAERNFKGLSAVGEHTFFSVALKALWVHQKSKPSFKTLSVFQESVQVTRNRIMEVNLPGFAQSRNRWCLNSGQIVFAQGK